MESDGSVPVATRLAGAVPTTGGRPPRRIHHSRYSAWNQARLWSEAGWARYTQPCDALPQSPVGFGSGAGRGVKTAGGAVPMLPPAFTVEVLGASTGCR